MRKPIMPSPSNLVLSAQHNAYALVEPEYIREPVDPKVRDEYAGKYVPSQEYAIFDLTYERLTDEKKLGPIHVAPLLPTFATARTALNNHGKIKRSYTCDDVLASFTAGNPGDRKGLFFWLPVVAAQAQPLFWSRAQANYHTVGDGQVIVRLHGVKPTVDEIDSYETGLLTNRKTRGETTRSNAFWKYIRREQAQQHDHLISSKNKAPLPPEWIGNERAVRLYTYNFDPNFHYDPAEERSGLAWFPGMDPTSALGSKGNRIALRYHCTYDRGQRLERYWEGEGMPMSRYNYKWVKTRT